MERRHATASAHASRAAIAGAAGARRRRLLAAIAAGPCRRLRDRPRRLCARRLSSKAARLFTTPAERGNARAQAMLGFMYATGQGVPQAYDAAVYWYRLAAEQGETRGAVSARPDVRQGTRRADRHGRRPQMAEPRRGRRRAAQPRIFPAAARCGGLEDDARPDRRGAVAGAGMDRAPARPEPAAAGRRSIDPSTDPLLSNRIQ